ncbi:MAG: hypothetical protein ACYCZN_07335 [Candidatus Dormibacteria bacterium]
MQAHGRWNQWRDRLPHLVRGLGPRCDFCGASGVAVALVAGGGPQQVTICAPCVGRLAARVGPRDGGDAA